MAAIEAFGSVAWQPLLPQTAALRLENQTPEKSAADDLAARIGPAYKVDISRKDDAGDWNDPKTRQLKRMNQIECQTCKSRKYQDVSNDPGVSFKAPTHLTAGSEAAAVSSHEQEHVGNEQAKARNEGREVVSQSVSIFTSVCPECGRAFVSGGQTRTTTAAKKEEAAQKPQETDNQAKAAS